MNHEYVTKVPERKISLEINKKTFFHLNYEKGSRQIVCYLMLSYDLGIQS